MRGPPLPATLVAAAARAPVLAPSGEASITPPSALA